MIEQDEVREAARQVMGDGEEATSAASERAQKGWTAERRAAQRERFLANMRRGKKGTSAPSRTRTRPPASDAAIDEQVKDTVANMVVIGGYLAIFMPHTGLAITGVPHPDAVPDQDGRVLNPNAEPIVRSRAEMSAEVLRDWARRDERVLEAMVRFNRFLRGSAMLEVGGGLGAALAVDMGLVPAQLAIEVGPFRGENAIQPISFVIGDVVQYVAALQEGQSQRQEAAPGSRQQAPDGAEVIQGDVTKT